MPDGHFFPDRCEEIAERRTGRPDVPPYLVDPENLVHRDVAADRVDRPDADKPSPLRNLARGADYFADLGRVPRLIAAVVLAVPAAYFLFAALMMPAAAVLEHAHLLLLHPRDARAAALARLVEAGWDRPDIVTWSQLVSFVAFQARLAAGLGVLSEQEQ